jgi:hypothetical protein
MYLRYAGWGRQSLLPTTHSLLAARISLIGKLKFPVIFEQGIPS